MLLNLYQLNYPEFGMLSNSRSSDYYPEVQAGYIGPEGVEYLYKTGLRSANTADAVIRALIGALPGAGWGLSAVAVAASYGGKSALESAVNKAYAANKGIKVYYQIHVSIQSLNKVSYVVG